MTDVVDRPLPTRSRRGRIALVVAIAVLVVALALFAAGRVLAGHHRADGRAVTAARQAAERYASRLGTALQTGDTEVHQVAFPQIDRIGYRAAAGEVELTFESVQVVDGTTVQADDVSRCFAIRSPARPPSAVLPLAEIGCDQLLPVSPTPTTWTRPAR